MEKLAIDPKVVSKSDIFMIQEYSTRIGKISRLQGFSQFTEQQTFGLFSTVIGVLVAGDPIPLCTIVASRESSGGLLWSVRGAEGQPLPGVPERLTSVMEVLRLIDEYMMFMASGLAKRYKIKEKSFFQKLWSGW